MFVKLAYVLGSFVLCAAAPAIPATPAWTPREVRAALTTGERLSELAQAVLAVPERQRAAHLVAAIQFRFPRGTRLVHFADLHRHKSNLGYEASIVAQTEFLHWVNAHPGSLIFAEGLTEDVHGEGAREATWRAVSQRWVSDFFTAHLTMPRSLEEFADHFDRRFWEVRGLYPTIVSFYPTPAQVALYSMGGPRAAFLLGRTDRLYAASRVPLVRAAASHVRGSNEQEHELYKMLFREAAALLAVERVVRLQGPERPALLMFGKAHDFERTFRGVVNLEISTTTGEDRGAAAAKCREALLDSRAGTGARAGNRWWRGILKTW